MGAAWQGFYLPDGVADAQKVPSDFGSDNVHVSIVARCEMSPFLLFLLVVLLLRLSVGCLCETVTVVVFVNNGRGNKHTGSFEMKVRDRERV